MSSFEDVFGKGNDNGLSTQSDKVDILRAGGGDYQSEFINSNEENKLIDEIRKQYWTDDLRRRVQHYGYRYDYKDRVATSDDKIGELPDWVSFLCDRLVNQKIFETRPEQLIINEYEPGQGIAPHTDRDCFGPVVASISLGSDCIMDIYRSRKDKKDRFPIVLEQRSLLVLRGAARERWMHGIRPNKSDEQNGNRIERRRRLSLTFRTMALGHGS